MAESSTITTQGGQEPSGGPSIQTAQWLAPCIAAASVIVCGLPLLHPGRFMVMGDIAEQFLAWEVLIRQAFTEGRLPLWNDGALGGYPLLANLQSSVFYPPDLILLGVEVLRHFNISLFLHLFVAAFGTYLLARKHGISPAGSSLAAVSWSLSGFTMIHLPFGNHLTVVGASWIPWVFLGAALTVSRRDALAIAATAPLIAMQFLAGHPQMFVYAVSFASLYVLLSCPWRSDSSKTRGILGTWILSLVLGALLCSIQLIPVVEWIPYTARHEALDFNQATEFGFGFHRLIALFLPDFFGSHINPGYQHWDNFAYWSNAYIGGFTILAACLALVGPGSQRKLMRILFVVGFAAFLCACGRDNPLYRIVLMLPGFKHFRAPAKFIPIFSLCMAVMAGAGLDSLICDNKNARRIWNRILLCTPPVLIGLILWGWFGVSGELREIHHASWSTSLGSVQWIPLLLSIGMVFWLQKMQSPKLKTAIPLLLVAVMGLDLVIYSKPWVSASLVDRRSASALLYPRPDMKWLLKKQEEEGFFRIATASGTGLPNLYAIHGLSNLSGYDPMAPASTIDFVAEFEGKAPGEYRDDVSVSHAGRKLADRFVKYVVLQPQRVLSSDKTVWEGGYANIVEIPNWQEDRFAVNGLEESDRCQVLEFGPGKLLLNIELEKPQTVTLPLTYAPGWRYSVDDNPVQTSCSPNNGLAALRLHSGEHQVTLEYSSRSVLWGEALSLAGLVILGVISLWGWKQSKDISIQKLASECTLSH